MTQQKTHPLQQFLQKSVKVITTDGRVFIGKLKGLDQAMNMILSQSEQRIYSKNEGVKQQPLGVYFIRGDSIIMMGQFQENEQDLLKLKQTNCDPLIIQLN